MAAKEAEVQDIVTARREKAKADARWMKQVSGIERAVMKAVSNSSRPLSIIVIMANNMISDHVTLTS